GSYQVKMAISYYAEHIKPDGRYHFWIEKDSSDLDYSAVGIDYPKDHLKLFKARMDSRHMGSVKYHLFVLLNTDKEGLNAIEEHFCTCKVGRRTVGCCAHVACLIWYLAYGCYQDQISLPAKSLSSYFN